MNRKVRVKDIAQEAGVSTGTVDRVLNKHGRVSEETRKKVLQIANQLGYKPNMFAKSLSSKRLNKIVICLPAAHINNPYWEKPIEGIEKAKKELADYNFLIQYYTFDASSQDLYSETLDRAIDEEPDGIIFSPLFNKIAKLKVSKLKEKQIPFVFMDIDMPGAGNLAYFGQEAMLCGRVAGSLMKTCLTANSNVLIIKIAPHKDFSAHIRDRIKGFKSALSVTGITTTTLEIDIVKENEPNLTLQQHLMNAEKYQGVFVPNSRAFKVAEFIEQNHVKDMVVIGNDVFSNNVRYLEKGIITFLLGQKPEEQVFNAIMALFNHLILKKEVVKKNYSPINIIIKDNVKYYHD
ncbi:LacI family DNA-binding transcriptional regulator [Saccharicrinis sp. 156]|uniref:LacI family DNA-binding transcriptional regulator n=1 Tax=Saccharicrinis sp. 156 TaxID=3417574 RepID=UPI003D33CAF1